MRPPTRVRRFLVSRSRVLLRTAAVLALVVGLTLVLHGQGSSNLRTAATTTSVASATAARALCHAGLRSYSTASLTTVGVLRSVTWGPDTKPLPEVFPGAPASDPAAWCWVASGGNAQIYVVHAGDAAFFVIADAIGPGPVPSGVPEIS